ncbi:MAG: aldehyde dehydrogenase family protein [Pirellulaceae bacterium]|jgi:aldehyde dehydrogenase (NAD+)
MDDRLAMEQRIATLRERSADAQKVWRDVPTQRRSRHAALVAKLLAEDCDRWLERLASPLRIDPIVSLAGEILPLADAALWLSRQAAGILADRHASFWQRPWWMGRMNARTSRIPWGRVLILGAWNYPLLLMGVQSLQALVAGNSVLLKPPPGGDLVAQAWKDLLVTAGFPADAVLVLNTDPAEAQEAMRQGIEHVVLTGSSSTGRKVLEQLVPRLTPATLELSGCDTCVVWEDADLDRAVSALAYSLSFNASCTCMAIRRVLCHHRIYDTLIEQLERRLQKIEPIPVLPASLRQLKHPWEAAHALGAKTLGGVVFPELTEGSTVMTTKPLVLVDCPHPSPVDDLDVFAPWLAISRLESIEQLKECWSESKYGLTTVIFGGQSIPMGLKSYLRVGTIVIDDLFVPTADPQLTFGGMSESGYGVTRGVEGLLGMTRPQVVAKRLGRWLPHLESKKGMELDILKGILLGRHGVTWRKRLEGWKRLAEAGRRQKQR